MVNQAVQAQPEATGGEVFLVLASLVALALVWIAVARAVRRRGAPAWLGHITAALVSSFYFFLMAGIGFASKMPVISGAICIGVAIACLILANRVPLSSPTSLKQRINESTQGVRAELVAAKARIAELEASRPTKVPLQRVEPTSAVTPLQPDTAALKSSAGDLAGMVKEMMADGVFVQAEAEHLFQWLHENQGHLHEYPASAIYNRLTEALADGVLDEDEADDISELFQRLGKSEPGVAEKVASSLPRPLPPPVQSITPTPRAITPPKPRVRRSRARTGLDCILIQYQDSMGFDSEREVTVHSLDTFYLKGYCHMRSAPRTFRVDRIVGDIVRTETGEALPFWKWKAAHT